MSEAQAIVAKVTAPAAETSTNTGLVDPNQKPAEAQDGHKPAEVPPKQEEKQEDQNLSARFAALSRREKMIVEKEKTLKEQMAKIKEFEDQKKGALNDPLDFLNKNGLSLDQVLEAALGAKREPSVDEKIAKLQQMIEERDKAAEEAKKKEQEEAEKRKRESEEKLIADFKAKISKHVEDNAEKYELIKENNASELVYEVIEQYYAASVSAGKPEILEIEKAADLVEDHLYEQAQGLFKKSKKLSSLIGGGVQDKTKDEQPKTNLASPTLSNAMSNGSSVAVDEMKGLTREERLKKAASLLKWT